MIALQHQPSTDVTSFCPPRPVKRRRLHEVSTMCTASNKKLCLTRQRVGVQDLPPEILGKILSYLPHVDLVRSSQACRQWYHMANDPLLWRDLDFSGVPQLAPVRGEGLHRILETNLTQCRSFYTRRQPKTHLDSLSLLLRYLARSKSLTNVTFSGYLSSSCSSFLNFFHRCDGQLTHIDLSRSQVPNCVITAILAKHGCTLVSLDLEFSTITEFSLGLISQEARMLEHLGLAGCLSVSSYGLKRFLTKGVPETLKSLDIRWMMDTEIGWLERLLQRRNGIKVLVLDGCDKLTDRAIAALGEKWPGVDIRHTAKAFWESRLHVQRVQLSG